MPKRHHLKLAAAALTAGVLLLAGCAGATGPTEDAGGDPVVGGEITVGGLASKALDPGQAGFSSQSLPWTKPIFGSLFLAPEEAGGDVRPGLATGAEYSDDGLELTITLREGLQFQDETPLDADAVVWNFNRHIENATREKQFFQYVTDISASDATTVVVTFSQPQNLLLSTLPYSSSGFMASPTAFEAMGVDAFNASPVGAGPFKIASVDPGQELVLEKADTYWDAEHVYLDGITFLNSGADPQASLVGLQADSLQSISWNGLYTSAAVLGAVEADTALSLQSAPSTYVLILPINTYAAPFDDLRARQAINYCMDRESLATNVSQGYTTPAFVLAGNDNLYLDGWEEGRDLSPLQHDVDAGTELVDELGGLSFTVSTNINSPILTAMQQQWAECGIDAQINRTDDYLSLVQNGNYQAALTVNANASPNPALSTNYLDPNAANNKFGWSDDEIWATVQEAKGVSDPDEARDLWQEIWTGMAENGYLNPIVGGGYYVASSANLQAIDTSSGLADYTNAWLAP
jgi:peptide/nickel transport system substrate-binding protein